MKQRFAATLLCFATLPAIALSADLEAGKAKAQAQCAACHASNGNWNQPLDPSYPVLAGQNADYLRIALKAYREGGRTNAIMAGQAASLTNDEIANLAAYLASLEGSLHLKK
ncbi:MAG: c-type cytochrome [Limnobacter sp.]|nr:c-type cytochrome [Limnobacter sp.]